MPGTWKSLVLSVPSVFPSVWYVCVCMCKYLSWL